MKQSFIFVYDYGMGGVWGIMSARTPSEVEAKYPMLKVQVTRPTWMTEDHYRRFAEARSFDVDDEPSGWLLTVLEESGAISKKA